MSVDRNVYVGWFLKTKDMPDKEQIEKQRTGSNGKCVCYTDTNWRDSTLFCPKCGHKIEKREVTTKVKQNISTVLDEMEDKSLFGKENTFDLFSIIDLEQEESVVLIDYDSGLQFFSLDENEYCDFEELPSKEILLQNKYWKLLIDYLEQQKIEYELHCGVVYYLS